VVRVDSILYDTLSNGKIVARDLPGEIYKVHVDENETYLRTNFSESDNRDFRDGDKKSTRNYQSFGGEDDNKVADGKRMYNSPQHKVSADDEGNLVRE
jgi:gliding motility-associated lipoprotein GldJ